MQNVSVIQEFISALFKAGLPMGLASFALTWWALKKDYLGQVKTFSDFESGVERLSKAENTTKTNPVHKKWMTFGGGFYGLAGLLTYAVVEWGEIRQFFEQFSGVGDFMSRFGPGMLVDLFIDALMNSIIAFAWPIYWLSDISGEYVWVWFLAAYAGYWAGVRFALMRYDKNRVPSL